MERSQEDTGGCVPPASPFPVGCSWMWPFEVNAETADVGDGEKC